MRSDHMRRLNPTPYKVTKLNLSLNYSIVFVLNDFDFFLIMSRLVLVQNYTTSFISCGSMRHQLGSYSKANVLSEFRTQWVGKKKVQFSGNFSIQYFFISISPYSIDAFNVFWLFFKINDSVYWCWWNHYSLNILTLYHIAMQSLIKLVKLHTCIQQIYQCECFFFLKE